MPVTGFNYIYDVDNIGNRGVTEAVGPLTVIDESGESAETYYAVYDGSRHRNRVEG